MDKKTNNRIGIFEYDWSMYSFIKDFAIKFAEAGYWVDIFYTDVDITPDFANISQFDLCRNIRYFNFATQITRSQIIIRRLKRLRNRLAIYLAINLNDNPDDIIDLKILNKSKLIISESQYLCFIGVEKKGLIWAGILSQAYRCPLIYYSLELYIEDNPEIDRYYHLREAEKRYHQLSCATIIQDNLRANALLKSNGIEHTNVLYLPISVRGKIVQEKSKFLHRKFAIDENKKILLYFGSIQEARFITPLVKIVECLDDSVVLVLRGLGQQKYLKYLQSIADKDKVKFVLDFIAEDDIIGNIISSAHIGVALYGTTNSNERLVAFSSVKLAYYFQCGIPVIAFNSESVRELFVSFKCGELIDTVDEIPQKAQKILGNYQEYQKQAYSAFEQFYDLDKNFTNFIAQFGGTIRVANSSNNSGLIGDKT